MNLKTSTIVWTFIWCLFMGVTVGSIGIGAVFPPANLIARPFVCPGGKMELTTREYNPSPIETVTTLTWYCVNGKTGIKTELGIFPMVLYSGAIYGFILFLLVLIAMIIFANKSHTNRGGQASDEIMESMRNLRLREETQVDPDKYVDKEKYDELAKRLQAELDKNKKKE